MSETSFESSTLQRLAGEDDADAAEFTGISSKYSAIASSAHAALIDFEQPGIPAGNIDNSGLQTARDGFSQFADTMTATTDYLSKALATSAEQTRIADTAFTATEQNTTTNVISIEAELGGIRIK